MQLEITKKQCHSDEKYLLSETFIKKFFTCKKQKTGNFSKLKGDRRKQGLI
jgi:hypothetical protein